MTKLLRCPFCGSEAKHCERHNPMSKWRHSIDCASSTCGMSGPVEATKADAIRAWNTRATPLPTTANNPETDAHRDLVEAAKGMLPTNAAVPDWLDDKAIIPLDVTAAELRALRAALTKAEVTHGIL